MLSNTFSCGGVFITTYYKFGNKSTRHLAGYQGALRGRKWRGRRKIHGKVGPSQLGRI